MQESIHSPCWAFGIAFTNGLAWSFLLTAPLHPWCVLTTLTTHKFYCLPWEIEPRQSVLLVASLQPNLVSQAHRSILLIASLHLFWLFKLYRSILLITTFWPLWRFEQHRSIFLIVPLDPNLLFDPWWSVLLSAPLEAELLFEHWRSSWLSLLHLLIRTYCLIFDDPFSCLRLLIWTRCIAGPFFKLRLRIWILIFCEPCRSILLLHLHANL